MGQIVRLESKEGSKVMTLDTTTGEMTPIKQVPTMDWVLRYADIEFKNRDGKITAKFTNLDIRDPSGLYGTSGTGETANEAVKDLAEDIKNETVIVKLDNGEYKSYRVDNSLNFTEITE